MKSNGTTTAAGGVRVRAKRGLFAATVIFIAVAGLYLAGALRVIDNKLLDARFTLVTRPVPSNLVIVAMDPESLERIGVWPWPREDNAKVIENLVSAGAARIAFDVDFSSASNPASDKRLADALANSHGRVTLAVLKQGRRPGGATTAILTEPLPAFRELATLASVSVRPDGDGVVRRINVREPWREAWLPSVPALLANRQSAPDTFYIDFGFDPASIPQISYADVLAGTFDPASVAGKAVIVGATAVQLGDYLTVPRYGVLSGAQVLGLAYHSLANGRALQHLGGAWVLAAAFLLAFTLCPLCVRFAWRRSLLVLGASSSIIIAALVFAYLAGVIVDGAPLLLAAALSFIGGLAGRSDWQALLLRIQGREMRHRETMMNGVVHNSFDAIFIMDDSGVIEEANDSAVAMFGDDGAKLRGRDIVTLIARAGNLIPHASTHIMPMPVAKDQRNEVTARRLDGSDFPVEIVIRQMITETGRWQIAFVRDITERMAHQRALEHQALHDSLTGLPNRACLFRTIHESIHSSPQSQDRFALLLLDLNRFKEINDTLGHNIGDVLLGQIANRLKAPLRHTDTIARLGGDEFAVVLKPAPDRAAVDSIAERLQRSLDEPFQYNGMSLDVGVSIGVSFFPDDSGDATELLQKADVAMYAAKLAGQPMAFYDRALDQNSVRHLTLTGDLRRAIEDNKLMLYFQPKISIETHDVVGVESLLRWEHPTHGFIPPDEFVALAERTGLVRKMTDWVLDTALSQSARWHAQGLDLAIAVNLSARSLQDGDLPGTLDALLQKHGVAPAAIALELTESAIMADPVRARAVIGLLNARGFYLSIDDFGTGYSSLGYLKNLPVHELKIDKSFVLDMMANENDRVIVKSTVDLAHNLGLSVVAEGVESAEVLEELNLLGADVAQGYFISRPVPAAAFEAWLSDWRRAHARPALQLVAQAG